MVVLVVAGWVLALVRRLPVAAAEGGGEAPQLSVIAPARNEARRLPAPLAALVAAAGGARVVASGPPPGWTGKAADRAGIAVAWWPASAGTTSRTYPDGLRSPAAGWSENLAAGAATVAPRGGRDGGDGPPLATSPCSS